MGFGSLSESIERSLARVSRRFRRANPDSLNFLILEEVHELIREAIKDGKSNAFLVGRSGTTEAKVMRSVFRHSIRGVVHNGRIKRLPRDELVAEAKFSSGICGSNPHGLVYFAAEYLSAATKTDVYAHAPYVKSGTGIAAFLESAGTKICRIPDLEPLNALRADVEPWTSALSGKRVLVVHPFRESILRGYERRRSTTGIREILPDFGHLEVIEPPVTFLDTHVTNPWDWHLRRLKERIASAGKHDVVIAGAGAYGLPIASFAKDLGAVGIHLGGATQLLFGIRGARWEAHATLGPWIDETWLRPIAAEHFVGHQKFEGGKGYW